MQGLELLVMVLLARNRQPPPTVTAGVPHAELAAELLTLPSGLLAKVCEAIVRLKVRLGGCLCMRACVWAAWAMQEGPTRSRRVHSASHSRVRGSTHLRGFVAPLQSAGSTASRTARCRFPMWSEPAAIRRVRARCVVARG